jgi:hypothetical protein
MPSETVLPASPIHLPGHEQRWLEAQDYSHAPNQDRHESVDWLNDELQTPFKRGKVFGAFNSGEIPTALISGKACASKYDLARWALLQKYKPRNRHVVNEKTSAHDQPV